MIRLIEPGWPHGDRPKPDRVWSAWKTGRLMEYEINAHPHGFEVRFTPLKNNAFLCTIARSRRYNLRS